MMTGRLAAADSVTGMQSPATMISAVILRPHPRLSRVVAARLLKLLHDPVDHHGQQAAGGCQK
jgi:hypothetical protein